jgi:hypothetical protein
MSKQAEVILRDIIEHAVEREITKLPAVWRQEAARICYRVVNNLVNIDATVVELAIAATKPSTEET